ncbi:putative G-protein-coupled receptor family protein [Blattamonas nauphoetae]|uniref:G-protein-coupled receptor family protein n=1 Tax=Blattamonas nauphoetae TaxID=2049346 RepID=A0ABQ9Y037_9EUKA|nr:putative G-protein-coupled receptor family protein [Blattamonas nauphoetae]
MPQSGFIKLEEATLEDKLTLSPWAKWHKYRIFPWKFVVHIVTLLLIILQITIPSWTDSPQTYRIMKTFDDIFMPEDFNRMEDKHKRFNFYKQSDCFEAIKGTIDAFFSYDEDSLDSIHTAQLISTFEYIYHPNWQPISTTSTVDRTLRKIVYNITEASLYGPFEHPENLTERTDIFQRVEQFVVRLRFNTYMVGWMGGVGKDEWDLRFIYDFSVNGVVSMYPWYTVSQRGILIGDGFSLIVSLLLLVACVWSMILIIKQFLVSRSIMKRTRALYNHQFDLGRVTVPWKKIPLFARYKFFDPWYIVQFIGVIFTITGTIVQIILLLGFCPTSDPPFGISLYTTPKNTGSQPRRYSAFSFSVMCSLCLSCGALLNCIFTLRFFKWSKKYYHIVYSLRLSLPVVFRFIVGASTLFIGFTLLGTGLYSDISVNFETFGDSIVTLFAMMFGDSLLLIYRDVEDASPFLAAAFLVSFTMLFICVVLNIFISIIEEGYVIARERIFSDDEEREQTTEPQAPQESAPEAPMPVPDNTELSYLFAKMSPFDRTINQALETISGKGAPAKERQNMIKVDENTTVKEVLNFEKARQTRYMQSLMKGINDWKDALKTEVHSKTD